MIAKFVEPGVCRGLFDAENGLHASLCWRVGFVLKDAIRRDGRFGPETSARRGKEFFRRTRGVGEGMRGRGV